MAVGVVFEFSGATLAQYDEIMGLMNFTPNGKTPPEALFHWAAATDDGLFIVDVWKSRAAFDKFAEEQIGPFSAKVGITEPPKLTFYDVHNYLSAG